jgi:hypothetical protein
MDKGKKQLVNAIGRASYAALAAIGAAPGQRSRATTQRSGRDKARCPRRQRKTWRNSID